MPILGSLSSSCMAPNYIKKLKYQNIYQILRYGENEISLHSQFFCQLGYFFSTVQEKIKIYAPN
jgi:hypothetical protein